MMRQETKKEKEHENGKEAGGTAEKKVEVSEQLAEEAVTLTREEWKNLNEQAAKAPDYHDKLLRLAADLDNFRKRTENEKRQLSTFVESRLLSRMLPVLDSMEQVLRFSELEEDKENLHVGIKLFAKELHRTLNDLGLKPLELLGKPFDPSYAEAVEVTETGEYEDGTILSILRTGYQYQDQVIRPAMVKISKRPSNAESGSPGTGQD